MRKLNFITLAIIGIYACLNFSSCKKDDEPKSDTLPDVFVGVWELDEYYSDDIYEIFKNGTGKLYTAHEMDIQKGSVKWEYIDGYILLKIEGVDNGYDYLNSKYKLVPISVSRNEIIFDPFWWNDLYNNWEQDDKHYKWIRYK